MSVIIGVSLAWIVGLSFGGGGMMSIALRACGCCFRRRFKSPEQDAEHGGDAAEVSELAPLIPVEPESEEPTQPKEASAPPPVIPKDDPEAVAEARKARKMAARQDVVDEEDADLDLSVAGRLTLKLLFQARDRKITITIMKLEHCPSSEKGVTGKVQLRLTTVPIKLASLRTDHVVPGERFSRREFELTNINRDFIEKSLLRIRLYTKVGSTVRLLGERLLNWSLFTLKSRRPLILIRNITPTGTQSSISLDPESFSKSLFALEHQGCPELRVALQYTTMSGRLKVIVQDLFNYKNAFHNHLRDTYCILKLVKHDGQERASSCTRKCTRTDLPNYDETFMFELPWGELPDCTLYIGVIEGGSGLTRSNPADRAFAWCSIGYQSSSIRGTEHWKQMIESVGRVVERSHPLCLP